MTPESVGGRGRSVAARRNAGTMFKNCRTPNPPRGTETEESPLSVAVREKGSGTVLAEAEEMGKDVITFEGNLYFAPTAVRPGSLRVTERTYTSPYKGTCRWVDYAGPDGATVRDVAWVYDNPKAGHEAIKDRFDFYAGSRGPTRQEG